MGRRRIYTDKERRERLKEASKRSRNKRRSSGIYQIKFNGTTDSYIGASSDLRNRKRNYLINYMVGKGVNSLINKYGIINMKFIILEHCSEDYLFQREQYYISELNPTLNAGKFATVRDRNKETAYKDCLKDSKCAIIMQEKLVLQLNSDYSEILISINI
jgi:group I intron endonuclease